MAENVTESHPPGQFLTSVDECWRDGFHPLQVGPAQMVVCPVCGFECIHPGTPRRMEADDRGAASWGGCGPLIVLPFRCESEHEWFLCFGFHKGTTWAFTASDPVPPEWRVGSNWSTW